ncbi:hypothetical protein BDA99DRAFT_506588 [Phascolomyces articulosus]|uniref:Uncharacterized protein n=1 Tax=Phascolomyces articulosus TaxID=60185 RepID=A0AAD5K300_9FUNG|nr:hypothetical protein BDA99DRAFT_506588 [Phascolomyces articulosus]
MDPYRPRPYGGYRPRPPHYYGRGGFRPNYIPGRPPMHHHPMTLPSTGRPPPMGNRVAMGGPGAVGGPTGANTVEANEGKLTTLFVGAIAPGITDVCLEKLLKAGGNLKTWKRMKDPEGNPKGFGFAEYEDPESVLRTLRVLGGENETHQGLTLTAMDGSGVQKKLIVKADDNVRNYLQQHQSTQPQPEIETKDKEALTKIYAYVDAINQGREPGTDEGEDTAMTEANTNQDEEGNENDSTKKQDNDKEPSSSTGITDDNDFINKELAFFKERAAQRDQEKQRIRDERREEEEYLRRRTRSPSSRRRRRQTSEERRSSRDDFIRGTTEQLSSSQTQEEMEMSDEELERRREEKHEKDVEVAFRQRERRLEGREATRLRNYERDIQRLKEAEERQIKEKEYWATRLAEWDDDIEIERGEEEFYMNRSRWRRHRELVRRREDERDEEDRRLEDQEIVDEQKRIEQKERMIRQKQEEEQRQREEEAKKVEETPRIAIKPTKISFNAPIKRISAMGGGEEEDEDEHGGRKRRVLVPLDYSDVEMALDSNNTNEDDEEGTSAEAMKAAGSPEIDQEERAKKVKELINSIPSSEQELWNWSVKWDQVDEELIDQKLKPFISKKIAEIVGAEDDEFVGFILDFVRQQRTPDSLVKELEMTLDAEALVFVMKLWRALIFETERKAAKL